MTSILDRPLKARTFTALSLRRRLANAIATVLVTLSVAVALIPLVWVLYSVVAKGLNAVRSSEWWTHSQADMTAFLPGGGAYHAIVGTVMQGVVSAVISVPIGIFVAMIFIGIPFVVRTVQPVLIDLDPEIEEAAASLGASRWHIITKVILPSLAPALLTGLALAFARAVGEYGSVIFIAGNLPNVSEIAPLLIVIRLSEFRYADATAIAVVMLVVSFVIIFAVNRLQRWTQSRAPAH